MNDDILKGVSDYYSSKVLQHGPTPAGADWKDAASQELRFAELLKITGGQTTGVLAEVGCGWGALPLWAYRHGYRFTYTGYDISPSMLSCAKAKCAEIPDTRFLAGSANFGPADWIVASGIFNVKLDIPLSEWTEFVDATLREIATSARKGFSCNFLTGFSDEILKREDLYYPMPGEMLDKVMRLYGRNTAILHNTGLFEFTLLVWK